MEPFFVGPLPAIRFITEFFPEGLVKAPQFKPNLFSDLVAAVDGKQDEQDMYDPFVSTFQCLIPTAYTSQY